MAYYLKGIAQWAEVHKINKYNKYAMKLIVTEDVAKEWNAIGTKSKAKEQEDGTFMISLTRDPDKYTFVKGEKVKAGAPEVVDQDGKPFSEDIGNGSEVTVKVDVFKWDNSFGKGVGARLDKIRVDKHVPYSRGVTKVVGDAGDEFKPF